MALLRKGRVIGIAGEAAELDNPAKVRRAVMKYDGRKMVE
jgi:hypothetical protein